MLPNQSQASDPIDIYSLSSEKVLLSHLCPRIQKIINICYTYRTKQQVNCTAPLSKIILTVR